MPRLQLVRNCSSYYLSIATKNRLNWLHCASNCWGFVQAISLSLKHLRFSSFNTHISSFVFKKQKSLFLRILLGSKLHVAKSNINRQRVHRFDESDVQRLRTYVRYHEVNVLQLLTKQRHFSHWLLEGGLIKWIVHSQDGFSVCVLWHLHTACVTLACVCLLSLHGNLSGNQTLFFGLPCLIWMCTRAIST